MVRRGVCYAGGTVKPLMFLDFGRKSVAQMWPGIETGILPLVHVFFSVIITSQSNDRWCLFFYQAADSIASALDPMCPLHLEQSSCNEGINCKCSKNKLE